MPKCGVTVWSCTPAPLIAVITKFEKTETGGRFSRYWRQSSTGTRIVSRRYCIREDALRGIQHEGSVRCEVTASGTGGTRKVRARCRWRDRRTGFSANRVEEEEAWGCSTIHLSLSFVLGIEKKEGRIRKGFNVMSVHLKRSRVYFARGTVKIPQLAVFRKRSIVLILAVFFSFYARL